MQWVDLLSLEVHLALMDGMKQAQLLCRKGSGSTSSAKLGCPTIRSRKVVLKVVYR